MPDNTTPLAPADWTEFRELGKRIIDDLVDYLADVRDRVPLEKSSLHVNRHDCAL